MMTDEPQSAVAPPLAGLQGARALVTGGSRGIGAATALLLAACGARVVVSYVQNREAAESVVAQARAMGSDALAVAGDLAHPRAAARVMEESVEALGGLDILVGNHGIWPAESVAISEMTLEQWRGTMEANLDSIFHVASAGARLLADNGRIVLVSSTAALAPRTWAWPARPWHPWMRRSRRVPPHHAAPPCWKPGPCGRCLRGAWRRAGSR